jgi:hypothetical protein
LSILLDLAYSAGWLVFLYLGGAGAYELLGGRRYRASLLLVAAFLLIALTFVYIRYAGNGPIGWVFVLLYFIGCGVLVRKVHGDLGKPDIR